MRIGSADAKAAAQPSVTSTAQATVGALAVSLFGGEITVESIDLRASVAAGSASASGNVSASTVTGLTVLGQLVTPTANIVIPLDDWGSLELLGSQVEAVQEPPRSAKATATAIRVKLIADHGGLLAGSMIELGSVVHGCDGRASGDLPGAVSEAAHEALHASPGRSPPTRPASPASPSPGPRPSSCARRRR